MKKAKKKSEKDHSLFGFIYTKKNYFMVKDFPLLPLEKISKKAGAERISQSAVKELKVALLEISEEIARDAVAACRHAKRVTVKKEDIRMAIR